jgi:glycosyltransferase involved in cell wall biosynthesis
MSPRPRILDIVNTDHAALNFLAYRVGWINENTEFENDVVCSDGPHLPKLGLPAERVTVMNIPRGMSPTGLAGLLRRVVGLLRARSYTIVHTHNSITGAIGRIAARLTGVPLVIHTTHGFHFHENMGAVRRAPYVAAERWLARCCDLLLCQNRQEMDEIRKLGIRPRYGVYHVGNGIDLRRFPPRLATPSNPRPVIFCNARFEAVKNHPMLFRALELLRRQGHDPVVRLVGEGPLRERYEDDLRARGLTNAVEFLGYRYDIPALTAAADVAVLPSVKEGIPRALMEAMALGVPVVATDVKGTREVVADGQTGFLVPLDDAEAFANRMARLFQSPELREQMGSRGIARVREHFSEEQVVRRLVRVYRNGLLARGLAEASPAALGERFQVEQGHA